MTRIEYGTSWAKVHGLPDPGVSFTIDAGAGAPDSLAAGLMPSKVLVRIIDGDEDASIFITPTEARDLAAWLLAAARHIEESR